MQWPCPPARQRLVAEYAGDELQLSMQMWTYSDHYALAFPNGSMTESYARFVGWIRARDERQSAVL